MPPKIGWYEFACISEYQEGKLLLFCENCQKIFFLRERTWSRLNGGTSLTLKDLMSHAKCCEQPEWLFITHYFRPRREMQNENPKNFISALDEEGKLLYIWIDMI